MDKIIVEGVCPLSGEVKISGAKNAALPILISSLLVDGSCAYSNVPDLMDIESTINLLINLGVRVAKEGNTVKIDAGGLNNYEAPYELVRKMRASILVLGPLVARLKKARVSLPGGCSIGARPINLHLKGLAALGAKVDLIHGYVEASADTLKGAEIYFDTVTVTGTENLMMAAVLAQGTSLLRNAAREPEVVALADVLNKMGAKIEGIGTSVLKITGVESLKPVSVSIIPDRIEAGTFMVSAALTGSDIKIINCEPTHLESVIHKLRLTGSDITIEGNTVRVKGGEKIS
ncbi:MAG: UDP-N-acetylglucosamine 1-carboxyvinyltransferase, partial [Desulfobacterium sp.]|nr:UDP-N-acetylglucosamine 1-carboxyvinyltransferase [Desulfobacterium sp.]